MVAFDVFLMLDLNVVGVVMTVLDAFLRNNGVFGVTVYHYLTQLGRSDFGITCCDVT